MTNSTDMARREPTQEPPSNWRVSLAFWLCLFCAAALYGAVSLAPGYLAYLNARQEYVEGQQRLVEAERQIEHLEKVAVALQQDPQFQAEVARIDLGLTTGGERISVSEQLAIHAVDKLPEYAEVPAAGPWFVPLVQLLAERTVPRWGALALSGAIVLFAFTYLQASFAHDRASRGLLRDTAGRFRGGICGRMRNGNIEVSSDRAVSTEPMTHANATRPFSMEIVDRNMARVLAEKSEGERLQIAWGMWRSAQTMVTRMVRAQSPTLSDDEINREVAGECPMEPDDLTGASRAQIQRLLAALEEVIDPEAIGPWLTAPNQSFEGLKPLEVIERGEIDRIWQMIYELRSGVAF